MAQSLVLEDLLQAPRGDKEVIRQALAEARIRTWQLVEGLDDADWRAAACDFLSPPAWDLGHMANFEELWLVQRLGHAQELHPGFNDIYDALEHPRQERASLRLLSRSDVRAYMEEVRARALATLDGIDLGCDALTRDGFVHWMLVLHEHQHQETVLQTLQMRGPERYQPPQARPLPAPSTTAEPGWVSVEAGEATIGLARALGAYDNESPAHRVWIDAFDIGRYPLTCGEYLRFLDGGGYEQARHWSARGRRWLEETDHAAPLYWQQVDGVWHRRTLRGTQPVEAVADEILCHVTWFEAEAYAHWAGARLPTEAEWEAACRGTQPTRPTHPPAAAGLQTGPGDARGWEEQRSSVNGRRGSDPVFDIDMEAADPATAPRNPWGDACATVGRANIDQLGLQPSRIGAYPAGASPCGAQHMIGDAWEWTSSDWAPYPGFEAYPYAEYSEVFFGGDYKVLRGGSWATRAGCATGTFRNWDHPYRRQIFAGIRLARDA